MMNRYLYFHYYKSSAENNLCHRMKRGNILFQSKCHSSFFPIESLGRQETYNNRFVQVT
nr:MAG TPA: hypothetical protein [Caudoviricetes sp.]